MKEFNINASSLIVRFDDEEYIAEPTLLCKANG